MKAILVFLIALIMANTTYAQSDWKQMQLKGKVKSLKNQWIYRYKKMGAVLFTPWERQENKTYVFNTTGRQTEYVERKSDSTQAYKVVYTYDFKAKKGEQSYFDKNNQPTIRKALEFDDKGRMTAMQEYSKDGKKGYRFVFEYDEKGNNVKMISYKDDGSLYSTYYWTYDSKGNKTDQRVQTAGYADSFIKWTYDDKNYQTGETWIDGNKNITFRFERTYDAQGNKIEESKYKDGNVFLDKTTWKYEYDKKGNWTKRTQYTNAGEDFNVDERVIEYY